MRPATILVIEDDESAIASLESILPITGCQIEVADRCDAMDRLASGPRPSLILLGMTGLDVDGLRFLAKQRIEPDPIPVVMMIAATGASEEWAQSLGAVALLRKPIDPARLLKLVRQYCPA